MLVRKGNCPGTWTNNMIRNGDKFLSLSVNLSYIISLQNPDRPMRTGILSAQVKNSKKGPSFAYRTQSKVCKCGKIIFNCTHYQVNWLSSCKRKSTKYASYITNNHNRLTKFTQHLVIQTLKGKQYFS